MRAAPTYEDFSIRFEPAQEGGGLTLRLLHSPCGPCPPERFLQPFSDRRPLAVLSSLESAMLEADGRAEVSRNLSGHSVDSGPPVSPEEVGRKLFESLFSGPLRENLLRCLTLIEDRGSTGLRLRLVLEPDVVEAVGVWPWELLYRFETRDFLGRGIKTPVVRQIEVQRSALTPTPIERLRILAVVSDPADADLEALQVGLEKERIDSALGAEPGIEIEYLEPPTAEALWRRLRGEPFDVLHFVGHGGMGPAGHGHVQLEDESGGSGQVSASLLADTLKGFNLKLVVLNACQTARLPSGAEGLDPFLGVATALVMAGIPAVVAMQFAITDRAAIAFSGAFYRSLAAGDQVESAVVDGRMAISHALPGSWEWATPVLFLGVPNGKLFTRSDTREQPGEARPAAPAVAKDGETQVAKAVELLERLRYDRALEVLVAALEMEPDDPAVVYYAALARLQGGRPRAARLDVIKKIEDDLEHAIDLSGAEPPAHLYYLQALIKHDFYRLKGLTIRPPGVEELLVEAQMAPDDPAELERLLGHVPTPPNAVRDAIEARVRGSEG